MKRSIFAAVFALAFAACASSTTEGNTAPGATQAAAGGVQTDGAFTLADINGMRVLVKRTPGAEFVAGQLYILGGVRNWSAQNAGIEQLALATSAEGGTHKLDKDAFARKLASLGSDVGAGSGNDFGSFGAKALKPAWDETFNLMVDAFLDPALPPQELEIQRARQLSGLHHEQESPDGRLGYLVHQQLFAGTPYANRAVGTLESVAAVKSTDLAPYLDKLRETSRLVLVVVGDVDANHVIALAKQRFGALPKGNYVATPLPPLAFAAPKLATEARKLPTNYIQGTFSSPGWKDADLPAGMVAMNLLGYRLFEEVRTKRNLSYAPGASLRAGSEEPTGYLYVTAVDPNTTWTVMLDEAKKLASTPATDAEVSGSKSLFLTGLLMGNETVDGQAGFLGRALIYGGDYHFAQTLPDRIRAVSAADIQKFAQTHLNKLQTVVLGDPAKINQPLFQSL